MKNNKSIIVALGLLSALTASANQPDSVYLFSYAQADGRGGLKLAWSHDGKQWNSLNGGNSFVNSDFGQWGSMKRMYAPQLVQTVSDGKWHCIWSLSQKHQGMAYVSSPDLVKWNPQSYFMASELHNHRPGGETYPVQRIEATVNSKKYDGCSQRVPYSLIERLVQYSDARRYRDALYAETMADEPAVKPFEATLSLKSGQTKPISDMLVGIFFEDINYAADGGLYAELVQNRDFEYNPDDNRHERWPASYAWKSMRNGQTADVVIADENPLHANNRHYAVVDNASLQNSGFDGITLVKGAKYRMSFFARIPSGARTAPVEIKLVDKDGKSVASSSVSVSSKNWKKYTVTLTPSQSVEAASLQLSTAGKVHFDMVSLFPHDTFKGRENGLRKDLAQTLADLKPRFVRFPGGCVAHGDGVDNIYDWKGSVGPLEARKPLRNIWNYHQTRGLGYHEYFQFCEDIGAAALPVLAAGVPCQNSATCAHHSHDEVTNAGQQGGIPMEEMPQYVQDVLDLIEYANGDAKTTEWGAKRARNGHPKPFNLKYVGIGNEDMITEVFEPRFKMIADAVRQKYPEITVVGTVGPFYEGTDYERGWQFATEQNVPVVDEHYYVAPGWMVHNNNYYDSYDRSKPKVYLGEYAAHLPGRPSNIETALSCAHYLTGVERNADVVVMTSYAPLLAKDRHIQWNPDLIYFNNTEVKPTVDYYVQQMYGNNAGNTYVASELNLTDNSAYVAPRVKASVVQDSATGDYIIKLVNLTPAQVSLNIDFDGIDKGMNGMTKTVLAGNPTDKQAKPQTTEVAVESTQTLGAHSFTVLRLHK